MIKTIAQKEFRTTIRNRSFLISGIIVLLLMIIAINSGYQAYKTQNTERVAAAREQREKWLNQDPKHPHIAAHFGNFAFMPKTVLSLLDQGLDSFTGTVVYLEPHRQNDFSFKPAEQENAAIRFGEVSLAMVLQLIFPLLIIFICYDAFAGEYEQQTLQILYAQGAGFKDLYVGKLLGYIYAFGLLFTPALLLCIGAEVLLIKTGQVMLVRMMMLFVVYAVYLVVFIAFSLFASAYLLNSKKTMLVLLGCWLFMAVLLPKWAANTGDNFYPLPSKYEFADAIHRDIAQGINGHDPSNARALAVKKALLKKYHVDTVTNLPFNFEGYIMQLGENYSSKVYDKHFGVLQQTLEKQNIVSQWCSLVDPVIAIKNISMGLSGTDYYAHLNFQQQAESYRQSFVKQMNGDMEFHSKMGDWDYKADRKLFSKVPAFIYAMPDTLQSLQPYWPGFFSLVCWLFMIIVFIRNYPSYLKRT